MNILRIPVVLRLQIINIVIALIVVEIFIYIKTTHKRTGRSRERQKSRARSECKGSTTRGMEEPFPNRINKEEMNFTSLKTKAKSIETQIKEPPKSEAQSGN